MQQCLETPGAKLGRVNVVVFANAMHGLELGPFLQQEGGPVIHGLGALLEPPHQFGRILVGAPNIEQQRIVGERLHHRIIRIIVVDDFDE
ncbi:hypothetical protein D9M68_959890 [compost metagenome]